MSRGINDHLWAIIYGLYAELEIDPNFQGRGRVEVEGQIFRVDESEIEGRGSKVEVEGRNIFEMIFKFLKNFDF